VTAAAFDVGVSTRRVLRLLVLLVPAACGGESPTLLDRDTRLVERRYPLGAIPLTAFDFEPPYLDLDVGDEVADEAHPMEQAGISIGEFVVGLVRARIQDGAPGSVPGSSISAVGSDDLRVVHTEAVQEQVARLLRELHDRPR
jgi:hypothetical protein